MNIALRAVLAVAMISSFAISARADNARVLESYGEIPLAFTANGGQLDSPVQFTTTGGGCSMFFTPTGTTFLLGKKSDDAPASFAAKLLFNGANPNPKISGEEPLPWKSTYFTGDKSQWRTGVTNYGKVRLSGVYDGIDLVYYGNQKKIEYDFVVSPGKSPAQISLTYDLGADGETALSVNDAGELVVKTPLGNLVERKPYCYQVIDGKKVEVPGAYRITDAAANTFGFELGAYDAGYPLCIDPVLVYSTFLGGSISESGGRLAVDASGCAYVVGYAYSSNFPVTAGAYDTGYNGEGDISVTKMNAAGSALVFSTFIGGGTYDSGNGIAVDDSGYIYVGGTTYSSNFPVTAAAYDTTFGGGIDAFAAKLTPDGSALVYSTFIGGGSSDNCSDLALDDSGCVYLTGTAQGGDYPVTSGAFDTTFNGNYDAFATKLARDGSALVYSTFLGGSAYDFGRAIAVDGEGNAYVTGHAQSANFPVTPGAYSTTIKVDDGYVAKLNPTGSALVYSTFIGGTTSEEMTDIALDASGAAYVTGSTYAADYPVTPGAYSPTRNGYQDALVTKLSPDGSALVYSTFLGGGGNKYTNGYSIAVDNSGNAYVAGCTSSPLFPVTTGTFDASFGGGEDAFLAKLSPGGTALFYSTFLGGGGYDRVGGIAVDDSGNVYMAGQTGSSDFPVTAGSYSPGFHGNTDLFVMKMNLPLAVITAISPNGGGKWRAGSSHNITWASQNVANVKIDYALDGSTWTTIVSGIPASAGTYAWTVPDTASTNCRVRITDVSDAAVTDVSDSAFTITNPRITVTAPTGGESWRTGTTHSITCTSSEVDSVTVALYADDGATLSRVIVSHVANTGSCAWTVPADIESGADYRVRIVSANDSTVFCMSGSFTVYTPVITVTAPNGGEEWLAKSAQTIVWDSQFVTGNIAIQLRTDSGATIARTIVAATPDTGSYAWTVPADIADSAAYRVKVISLNDSTVYDVSDADFTISTPAIMLSSPNGGESWRAGSSHDITWTSQHVTDVTIEYTRDGSSWEELAASTTASAGTYAWTVPDTSSADCFIRITDVSDSTVTDVSDSAFTILNPRITVTAPTGGESWRTGTTHDITWTSGDVDSVTVALYADDGATLSRIIADSAPDTGSYTWTIPTDIESRTDYRVRIVSANDSTVSDMSDADFAVYTPGIALTSPNGGETWRTGTTQIITWTSSDFDSLVTLRLYRGSGATLDRIIADSAPDTGSYAWTLPPDIESRADYRVLITSATDSTFFDMGDADFTVVTPRITVTAPNGGESWRTGSAHTITWTSETVTTVNIEYSLDNSTWTGIASALDASLGTYRWAVPKVDSVKCSIRITDASDSTVTDRGDSVFTIYANPAIVLSRVHPLYIEYGVSILAPGTGLHNYNLFAIDASEFESSGSLAIDVAVDAASPFSAAFALFPGGTPIPASGTVTGALDSVSIVLPGQSARLTYQFAKGAVFYLGAEGGQGDSPDSAGTVSFTASVMTAYTLTSPRGGEKWATGKAHDITWTSTDEADSLVTIQLFREWGATFDRTIASPVKNTGTYSWDIPSDLDEEYSYRVRITSAGDSSEYGESSTDFIVYTPRITVTAPNGSEAWRAGSTHTISWTRENVTDSLEIRLYRNSGAALERIAGSAAADDGEFSWTIPADMPPGSNYRIRVATAADSTICDMSDADFTIEPYVSVAEIPAAFAVSPAYPNPFNPSTAIGVQLPEAVNVRVVMYNSLGQEVRVLHDGILSAGVHTLVWDGRNASGTMAASGVYFYSVRAGEHSAKGKVMFLR